jgi:hypothetical protein
MGDESAPFDGKGKLLRCPLIPPLKDLFPGQAVEGDIQFHGVKMFSVEFEPLSLGKVGWVEDTIPPMGIIITARSDEDHKSYQELPEKDSGIQGFQC